MLNRLGTQQWQKTKARVKKAMKDMAEELLKLYAARKTAEGHAFAADTEWQREFEDTFEFSETEDQMNAIVDVKRDMESATPMDRLLCGDVGYGKTEVAMRAAFKAVSDNRQVAVLAPTTVLAFQHYNTFRQRFAAFPIKIEMLSRFRTAKQQKETIAKLEAGKVDIVIGTHRVLSKDVKFSDLGLVIVDEEQRFGVRHKERLKQLRKEVDVLTMSATPIPRTLHMSLLGLRDMSVIETPPKDRMAIQTVVAAWDEKLLRSAIEKELERGGQVYFVHNRVESIYEIADKIREMVPKARILVGHGQMPESELERIMLAFMRHEADILVATTIIENGLDIPLCNTIIINRADRHGLSELYQLRGRVGRSDRRAYAYLLIPPDRDLTDLARRRLAALKEFSDLGAGFKIAALDLELRGAGNLLGGEQSGHIEAVGFELYTTMLERTVRELKGEAAGRGARDAIQSRPQHPHSRRLHSGGEPASAHVQARGRRRVGVATRRRCRRAGRSLRRAAGGGAESAGVRRAEAAVAAHRRGPDRAPPRSRQHSLHREGLRRSGTAGALRRRRAWQPVHARRRAEVLAEGEAAGAGAGAAEVAAGAIGRRAAGGELARATVPFPGLFAWHEHSFLTFPKKSNVAASSLAESPRSNLNRPFAQAGTRLHLWWGTFLLCPWKCTCDDLSRNMRVC